MKFYAHFESTSDYDLIREDHAKTLMALCDDCTYYNLFNSLKEAKAYLIMHFKGEINDARLALQEIKELTEEDF